MGKKSPLAFILRESPWCSEYHRPRLSLDYLWRDRTEESGNVLLILLLCSLLFIEQSETKCLGEQNF